MSNKNLLAWILAPVLLIGLPVVVAGCLAFRYAQTNFFRETFIFQIESVDESVVCFQPFDQVRKERRCLSAVPADSRWALAGRDPDWYRGKLGRCVEVVSVTHSAEWARVVELTDCPAGE